MVIRLSLSWVVAGVVLVAKWGRGLPRRTAAVFFAVALQAIGLGFFGAAFAAPFVFMGDVLSIEQALDSQDDYRIGERALIDVAPGVMARFGGVFSNMPGSPNGLVKLGGGLLQLSGANTYRGGTLLLQGGLEVAGPAALGRSTLYANRGTVLRYGVGLAIENHLQINAMELADVLMPGTYGSVEPDPAYRDVLQWIVDDGKARQLGSLSGTTGFVKWGAGMLAIDGDAVAYRGNVTVAEGVLAVNDFLGGAVRVDQGARLQGVGTVASAHIGSGGTLAPGNGTGTTQLTVNNDVVFEPGSRFQVGALPSGEADRLVVNGKALLDGDVVALAGAGDWRSSTDYTILQAAGGLDGSRFSGVETNLAFLTPHLVYDGGSVRLRLVRNDTPLDDVAQTPGEKEVADAIDDRDAGPSDAVGKPPVDPVLEPAYEDGADTPPGSVSTGLEEHIVAMDRDAARQALRQLGSGWHISTLTGLMDDSRLVREAVLDHASSTQGAWGRAYYSARHRGQHDSAAADRRTVSGFVTGGSRRVGEGWAAGVFFGAQQSRLRSDDAWQGWNRARADGLHLGLTITRQTPRWQLAIGAGHAWHRVDGHRQITAGRLRDALRGDYSAATTQVFGEAAWNAAHAVLSPFARLAWVKGRAGAFTERGGPAALAVAAARQEAVISTLGVRASHELSPASGAYQLAVAARIAWNHVAGSTRVFSRQRFAGNPGGREFSAQGQGLARQAWSLDLAATMAIGRRAELGMGYLGNLGRGLRDHGATLQLRWVL